MVDRVRILASPRSSAWFSSSRFSASVTRISWHRLGPRARGPSRRRPDIDRDRRERRGIDWCGTPSSTSAVLASDEPARRCARSDDAGADDEDDAARRRPTRAAPRTTPQPDRRPSRARREAAEIVRRRPRLRQERSRIGRAAQTTTRPASSPTFVPHSSVCGAISSTLATATRSAEHDPADPAGRHGLRVGDHEEQEDQDLRRGHDRPARSRPRRRARTTSSRSCSGRTPARRPTPDGQRDPERRRKPEQLQRRVISSPPPMITA